MIPPSRPGALSGVRVLDLTWVWSGPACAQLMAAHGADVIKVESTKRLDLGRMIGPYTGERELDGSGFYHLYNRGKRSITINLRSPEGVAIVRDLAAISDIVIENFSAGKINDMGLGFSTLAERNPATVLLSLPGMGATGPHRKLLLYGQNVEALSGMMDATGWPDRGPQKAGVIYCDPVAAYSGAFAAFVALRHARKTGQGQHIDLAMIETATSLLSGPVMSYVQAGQLPSRQGNRSQSAVPHAVFQSAGEDRWVAIAAETDDQWRSLAALIGRPDLAEAYPTLVDRLPAGEELERVVEQWTRQRSAEDAAGACRDVGVPASAVLEPRQLLTNSQLTARGYFVRTEEAVVGSQPLPGVAPMSATKTAFRRPAPRLGEHTDEILTTLVGYDAGDIAALRSRGVLE